MKKREKKKLRVMRRLRVRSRGPAVETVIRSRTVRRKRRGAIHLLRVKRMSKTQTWKKRSKIKMVETRRMAVMTEIMM